MKSINGNSILNSRIFNSLDKVYHYTSLESLDQIIQSMSLRFGKLSGMNDFTEIQKSIYLCNLNVDTELIKEKIIEKYNLIGQISLTQDSSDQKGWANNSMWGHYANKGEGCCLVFDKNRLICDANSKGHLVGPVQYGDGKTDIDIPYDVIDYADIETFFVNEHQTIFYEKTLEWKNENEFRILDFSFNQLHTYLNINSSLIAVIFHTICFDPPWRCPIIHSFEKRLTKLNVLSLFYEYENKWEGRMLKDSEMRQWFPISQKKNLRYDIHRF